MGNEKCLTLMPSSVPEFSFLVSVFSLIKGVDTVFWSLLKVRKNFAYSNLLLLLQIYEIRNVFVHVG